MLPAPVTRRRLPVLLGVLSVVVSLAACGADDTAGSSSSAGSAGSAEDFPTTLDGAYGAVTLDQAPERVIALNTQVAEILVSLGIQPVAVGSSADELAATNPWLTDTFEGTLDPDLLENYQVNLEAVAGYAPDLIVGSGYNFTDTAYQQAAELAPTFAGVTTGNDDWDETTRALATLVGADADPVVDDVQEACSAAQEELPGLAGGTYQWVATGEGQYRFGNGTWLECFGLVPAANQDNTQLTGAAVSEEQLSDLDADVVAMWDAGEVRSGLEQDARFLALPSVQADTFVWVDLPLAYAANNPGPYAYDYMIEQVLPVLQAARAA